MFPTAGGPRSVRRSYVRKKDKYNDDKITKTTSSKVNAKKLENYVNKMSKAFTMIKNQLKRLKETDYDLSDS